MDGGSVLEIIGQEIIGVMAPVSICMFLVVLLVYTVFNPSTAADATIAVRTAANLIYLESPTDSTTQKLEGAVLNAIVFVAIITVVTFVLVLLYYYRFTNFLIYYTRFSVFLIFSTMGSMILISIIERFNIPVDAVTFYVLLFNLTVLGTISVFSNGVPIIVKQSTMVLLGIIVAAWFSRLPEWTTWVVLVALALYDLVAVLAPGGPLKLLVELSSSREEELPALVYESRPTVGRSPGSSARDSSLGFLVAPGLGMNDHSSSQGVELQELFSSRINNNNSNGTGIQEGEIGHHTVMNHGEIEEVVGDLEERSPLVNRLSTDHNSTANNNGDRGHGDITSGNENQVSGGNDDKNTRGDNAESGSSSGIKLGMGDFIFYSVLVGRAAMYDLMTVYACYLAIISGLGCTLILLAVCRHALPALPISIALGVIFYFLTRLLMEPFVVGVSVNLMMF